jgi:mRNA interferase RelE/StbE
MRVQFMPAALKALDAIPDDVRERIVKRAKALADNPRPRGWEKVEGAPKGTCRIRQGSHRIIYTIQPDLVSVVGISDRKEAYTKKGLR